MRGEFIGVWCELWREVWNSLVDHEDVPEDIFCELYRELAPALKARPSIEDLADIIDNPAQSRQAFEKTSSDDIAGERALVAFLEAAHPALDDLGGDALSNSYFNLLAGFIKKFNLRYDLRRPCSLCPTLPGMFASLVGELRSLSRGDSELGEIMKDFEEAVRDLRFGTSSGRIKTCITKQVMLLEALASMAPEVTKSTLGDMCEEIGSWPHPAVRESLKKLYGFASDRSGIRHGKSLRSTRRAERPMEMRDMVAMSVLLAGFTPYLTDQVNADTVYWGD
jgi:hypothetical protein